MTRIRTGVFNPQTLKNVYELTQFAQTLWWEDEKKPGHFDGVVKADIIAPSLIDPHEPGRARRYPVRMADAKAARNQKRGSGGPGEDSVPTQC